LEQGTHNQLLANPDSAYAQLVKAQELTAQKEKATSFDDDDSLEGPEATNGRTIMGGDSTSGSDLKREETRLSGKNGELPAGLERKNTQRSIASEVLASRAAKEGQQDEKEKLYSFFYLAKRCYKINREYKTYYFGGLLAAIGSGMVYPAIAILFGYVRRLLVLTHSSFLLAVTRFGTFPAPTLELWKAVRLETLCGTSSRQSLPPFSSSSSNTSSFIPLKR
jgi:ATP-binding cassette subfamily B (MDR/TAP) protein 1